MAKESSSFCENPACLGLGSEWTKCCKTSDESSSGTCEIGAAKRFKFVQDDELQELSKGFVPKKYCNEHQMGSEKSKFVERSEKRKISK